MNAGGERTETWDRQAALERLSAETWDVVVIGGGVTGAGVARDAALRGLRVALVEAGDFAGGTSSKTTKFAHGGLRYLEMLDLELVREALTERAVLHHTRGGRDRVGSSSSGSRCTMHSLVAPGLVVTRCSTETARSRGSLCYQRRVFAALVFIGMRECETHVW
jgi:glycine/D-amino acid oxidase-like deaminating enzyme